MFTIREAKIEDIPGILHLLSQVLEIHAKIRPDIFISGTTKYTAKELAKILSDESRPIYAAVDEHEELLGYAFCVLENTPKSGNLVPFLSMYIDDLCVEEAARKQGIGEALFQYVRREAARLGCYELTLNVWEGNESAKAFYDKMGFTVKKYHMEYVLQEKKPC